MSGWPLTTRTTPAAERDRKGTCRRRRLPSDSRPARCGPTRSPRPDTNGRGAGVRWGWLRIRRAARRRCPSASPGRRSPTRRPTCPPLHVPLSPISCGAAQDHDRTGRRHPHRLQRRRRVPRICVTSLAALQPRLTPGIVLPRWPEPGQVSAETSGSSMRRRSNASTVMP